MNRLSSRFVVRSIAVAAAVLTLLLSRVSEPMVDGASLTSAASAQPIETMGRQRLNTPTGNSEGTRFLGRLPVAFVPNLGQWECYSRFVARIGR